MYEIKIPANTQSSLFLSDQKLEPTEVLYDFDGPRIFIAKDAFGIDLLAVQSDESLIERRFLVVDCSPEKLRQIKSGTLTLSEALSQPRFHIVDISAESFDVRGSVLSKFEDIPENRKPKYGTMLWSELQPDLSIRIISEDANLGAVRGSLLNDSFSRVKNGILLLAERAKQKISPDTKLWKEILNPVAQRFAFRSFEVSFSFGKPKDDKQIEILSELKSLFSKGAALISGENSSEEDFAKSAGNIGDIEDALTICAAFKEFSPSARSQTSKIELSGSLLPTDDTLSLTSAEYKFLRAYINTKTKKDDDVLTLVGKIMECDRQALCFDLRNITTPINLDFTEIRCIFNDSQEEAVLDAFNTGCQVQVTGVQKANSSSLEVSFVKQLVQH